MSQYPWTPMSVPMWCGPIEEVNTELEKEGYDPVLFGLTDKEYELISKNFARIRNHLMETNELIDKYKEYYEPEVKNNKAK